MVNDAMRGVDYLSARKDVDTARIGAFGCSGGGTMTAYFAALDDRVKAAAVACYFTSFKELLASPQGAQDAEQSIPHFIEEGMDFPDWVEAFAPKPYAVVSTESDMFPFAGARTTVDRRNVSMRSMARKRQTSMDHSGPEAMAISVRYRRRSRRSSRRT